MNVSFYNFFQRGQPEQDVSGSCFYNSACISDALCDYMYDCCLWAGSHQPIDTEVTEATDSEPAVMQACKRSAGFWKSFSA